MEVGKQNVCLLLIICFLMCHRANAKEKCRKLLDELADGHSKFVLCMVRYSSPAISCEKCIANYTSVTTYYNSLVSNETCNKEFINRNRLNVVYNMQKYLVDIWNKGFCYNCFDNGVPSNETIIFDNLIHKFQTCLDNPPNPIDVCSRCNGSYADLNLFYTQMDEKYKGRICFDTQDKMNRTRLHWSKELNCCHREYNLTLFLIATSLFTALPVAFYIGMYGMTIHTERNHEVLDADLNEEQHSTSSGVQSGSAVTVTSRPNRSNGGSNFEDIDKLKAMRRSANRTAEEPLKRAPSTGVASANDTPSLIDL